MTARDARRTEIVARAADHLLAHGLDAMSLRRVAAAIGTSDRMLLYYFRDKDELLAAAAAEVAERLTVRLEAGAPLAPMSFERLLCVLRSALRDEAFRPFMRLWLQLTAKSIGGDETLASVGGSIADMFIGWTEQRLDGSERRARAALLVATVDGLALLDAIGRGDVADPAIFGAGLAEPG